MNKNLTEMICILDASGSMHGLEADTIGGYNSMLEKQKAEEGEALVSTVIFDTNCKVLHDRVPIKEAGLLTNKDYVTGGCTALLDAVGGAIHHIGNVHKYAREEDRPAKTIVVIITDGMENASHRYTLDKVKQMIEHEKEKYGWEFLFLGANIDAVTTAGRMGIEPTRAVDYCCDSVGTEMNYRAVSSAMSQMRASGSVDENWSEEIAKDYKARGGKRGGLFHRR